MTPELGQTLTEVIPEAAVDERSDRLVLSLGGRQMPLRASMLFRRIPVRAQSSCLSVFLAAHWAHRWSSPSPRGKAEGRARHCPSV